MDFFFCLKQGSTRSFTASQRDSSHTEYRLNHVPRFRIKFCVNSTMCCVITECTNNFNLFQVSAQDFLAAKFNGNLVEKDTAACTANQQSIKTHS